MMTLAYTDAENLRHTKQTKMCRTKKNLYDLSFANVFSFDPQYDVTVATATTLDQPNIK